jgi:hypothetical protein
MNDTEISEIKRAGAIAILRAVQRPAPLSEVDAELCFRHSSEIAERMAELVSAGATVPAAWSQAEREFLDAHKAKRAQTQEA